MTQAQTEERDRLAAFGRATLLIMENDEEWSADTLDSIQREADNQELVTTDDSGMFKAQLIGH